MVFRPLIGGEGTKNPAKGERRKRSGNVEGRSLKRDRSQPLIALRVSPSSPFIRWIRSDSSQSLCRSCHCCQHANPPTRQPANNAMSDSQTVRPFLCTIHYCKFWNITTRTSIISSSVHKLTHHQRTGGDMEKVQKAMPSINTYLPYRPHLTLNSFDSSTPQTGSDPCHRPHFQSDLARSLAHYKEIWC